jgi:hypothetical protein
MPPFSRKREEFGPDGQLFADSSVVMYHSPAVLDADITILEEKGYNVFQFDCAEWESELEMYTDLQRKLSLPYLTHGLDGLDELIWTLQIQDLGIVLVFRRFDSLLKTASFRPKTPWHLLDIVARNSRFHMLFGDRLMALVQTDDPNLQIEPLGGHSVVRNPREWTNSDWLETGR